MKKKNRRRKNPTKIKDLFENNFEKSLNNSSHNWKFPGDQSKKVRKTTCSFNQTCRKSAVEANLHQTRRTHLTHTSYSTGPTGPYLGTWN